MGPERDADAVPNMVMPVTVRVTAAAVGVAIGLVVILGAYDWVHRRVCSSCRAIDDLRRDHAG